MEPSGLEKALQSVAEFIASPSVPTPDCLDDETFALYVNDALTAEERAAVAKHLGSCSHCFRELNQLRIHLAEISLRERLDSGIHSVLELLVEPLRLQLKRLTGELAPGSETLEFAPAEPALLAAAAGDKEAPPVEGLPARSYVTTDGLQVNLAVSAQGTKVNLNLTVLDDDTEEPLPGLIVQTEVAGQVFEAETDAAGRAQVTCYAGDELRIHIRAPHAASDTTVEPQEP
ncbi:MAG: zf-HC2 domain-containing protein [Armatimonadetes bacterium]|nr:zf-HC2 domain-containing protein [Armatimonadota bacterium]